MFRGVLSRIGYLGVIFSFVSIAVVMLGVLGNSIRSSSGISILLCFRLLCPSDCYYIYEYDLHGRHLHKETEIDS